MAQATFKFCVYTDYTNFLNNIRICENQQLYKQNMAQRNYPSGCNRPIDSPLKMASASLGCHL